MSSKTLKKISLIPDPVYNSIAVNMLVNRVMKNGKKSLAYRIVYNALREIGDATQENPVEVFELALENLAPRVEVKPRRRAGAIQMVPRLLQSSERGKAIALRWLLEVCRKRTGQNMISRLKSEILEASKKSGVAIRKKEEVYKLALSNAMYANKPQTVLNVLGGVK
uniref:ribosomal protein S7 n=1 Tax=Parallela transversalis TaxID=163324 RepID=UPI0010C51754|nr:ribosomal protein S7 [Parallela transversalis]AYQ22885.1 ribosomal protein S7 [Parallela transversalis]